MLIYSYLMYEHISLKNTLNINLLVYSIYKMSNPPSHFGQHMLYMPKTNTNVYLRLKQIDTNTSSSQKSGNDVLLEFL